MKVGDYFRVNRKRHFADGQIHRCTALPNIKLKGEPILKLGSLVEFVIEDYFGQSCRHVVPLEWCIPVERPSLAKRVY